MTRASLLSSVAMAGVLALGYPATANAQNAPLSGVVSSSEEGAMEGVIVSAKKEGSNITVCPEIVLT